jgi:hypothetical protein
MIGVIDLPLTEEDYMARLVVVDFDSDALADAFMAKMNKAANPKYRVVGLFAKPVRWCECPKPTGYEKNEVVMGGKYGWWIHKLCRRPRRGTHQAHNLLNPVLADAKYTTVLSSIGLFEVPTKNLEAARRVVDE